MTAPLLDYYEKKGLVEPVDGVGTLDEVTRARSKRRSG